MIEINAKQMKAVYQDLYGISVQIGRIERELEEIGQALRRMTQMEGILYQLKKEEDILLEKRYKTMKLSATLERITAVYCQTEQSIDQMMEEDVRCFGIFEVSVANTRKLTERIRHLCSESEKEFLI